MHNHFKEVILALADAGVNFVVAGGVAVVLHGVERVTMDLDVAVDRDPENLAAFLGVMKRLNLTPRAPVPAEILLDQAQVRKMVEEKNAVVFTFFDVDHPTRQVDVFLRDDLSYGTLREDAVAVEIDGREVLIVSKRKLIELKHRIDPPRPKDVLDITELEKLLGEDP